MSFATATAVQEVEDGVWAAAIEPGWDILDNANGGYMMAISARACSQAAGGRPPVSVTTHFTSPGKPGPVRIQTRVVREGRRFSMVAATMTDADGRTLLATLGSFGDLGASATENRLLTAPPPDLPPPEACLAVFPAEEGPFPPPFVGQVELRAHPHDAGFLTGSPSGVARMRGWFRLREGEPVGPFAMLVAVDAFPPTTFNASLPVAWTPTLELTTHVRALPAPGWLRCQFTTRFVSDGFLEEDGEVWDESDHLIAQSRQLALVPRD